MAPGHAARRSGLSIRGAARQLAQPGVLERLPLLEARRDARRDAERTAVAAAVARALRASPEVAGTA